MNLTDLLALALRNLRQAKLRTALTVMGVIVGVAAIITMVSFGLGLQNNIITQALARLEIFTTITVSGINVDALLEMNESRTPFDDEEEKQASPTPSASPSPSPSATPEPRRLLDDEAIAEIEKIPGVKYAVPQVNFSCYLRFENRTRRRNLSGAFANTERIPGFKKFLAGQGFSGDDAQEIIVTEGFAEGFTQPRRQVRRGPFAAMEKPDKSDAERAEAAQQLIGKEVILLTLKGSEVAPSSVFGIPLMNPPAEEAKTPATEFDQKFDRHVFKIVGVLPNEQRSFNPFSGTAGNLIPVEQAKRFAETNQDPMSQMGEALVGDAGYRQIAVQVVDPTKTQAVHAELKKRGFNVFPLPNLDEIKRVFLFVNGALALIGGIALLVASFGISNTMIMSIRERTREIGIMKAIGGSDAEIMKIFFFEACLIGFMGGLFGVLIGWAITSIANPIVNKYVVQSATTYIQFFSIPWFLWGSAILFAMLIALLAALYPASQAARVDPIKALRHD
ncbi:MAG: ABC transporter permease [Acidobacteria bacterium]|nr:ABC transporter permease [Acidobacteriota bacterium]